MVAVTRRYQGRPLTIEQGNQRWLIDARRKGRGMPGSAALLALTLAACSTSIPDMPRTQACQEQADAWCAVLDPGNPADASGCGIVYRHWCGMGGMVDGREQDACLDALSHMTPDPLTGYWVPDTCRSTWATR